MRRYSLSVMAFVLLLSAAASRAARADEFKLKDGSTIVGTVVGYQGNSFRVKTSYGYALVEKDKIVSIKIASAAGAPPAKTSDRDAAKSAAQKPIVKGAESAEEHASAATNKPPASAVVGGKSKPAIATPTPSSAAPADSNVGAVAPSTGQPTSPGTPAPQPATVATATPNAPPEPQPIREKISGNTYINDTYEFEMYKPPDWQVMDGARSVLPGAVAAMGTDDQSTYLVVGQEAAGKSPAAQMSATEERLNDILVNFRPLNDEHLTISGEQVVAHRFRGSVDEHDWSGFMVFIPRGAKLYTIFGMTRADNDLVQIQENVIRRTIASFQFLPQ
jgi:hypothetical protein